MKTYLIIVEKTRLAIRHFRLMFGLRLTGSQKRRWSEIFRKLLIHLGSAAEGYEIPGHAAIHPTLMSPRRNRDTNLAFLLRHLIAFSPMAKPKQFEFSRSRG
jgi:hypothetical protein